MFGAILKSTNSSFQKSMTFCRRVYVKKVMKLLAFIFEQPSYLFLGCLAFAHFLQLAMISFAHFLRFQLRTFFTPQPGANSV